MLGNGAKFDHKKEQAIAALLSHRNVEAAARAVGISSNTLLRWAKDQFSVGDLVASRIEHHFTTTTNVILASL